MNLAKWVKRTGSPWPAITIDQLPFWFGQFGYQGLGYGPSVIQTIAQNRETISSDFLGFINGAYKTNGAVFACVMTRFMLLSEARFQFRQSNNGRPGRLFGTNALKILETPWANGTTGDLIAKASVDVDMAGNFYATRKPLQRPKKGTLLTSKITRLRPDWMTIIMGSFNDADMTWMDPAAELVGYIYHPGGHGSGLAPIPMLPEEVAHWAPYPDPAANYRGMSWLQPVMSEVMGDKAMTAHKIMYFENGAALRTCSKVATPTGWTTMGEVKVGDYVMGGNGQPTKVLGVYPQGEKDFYRVTFTGGSSVECCEDHLWEVQTYSDRVGTGRGHQGPTMHRVMSLRSLVEEGIRYPSGPHKWSIPLTEPVRYDEADSLPLDPYIVGALLGDGHMGESIEMASHADDVDFMADEIWGLLPVVAKARLQLRRYDWQNTLTSRVEFRRRPQTARQNWLGDVLRHLGLRGLTGAEKVAPETYMRSSVEDRVALLQGLIDTDGHVEANQRATVRFTNISERLARQVAELAQSLGGVASVKRRVRKAERAQVQWVVSISRLPEGIVPCRLPRKVETYRLSQRFIDRTRFLKSVELAGRDQMVCIRVEAEDGLFLTDDFVVTHNSPNLVVSMDTGKMNADTFKEWVDSFEQQYSGVANAFKTLYLGHGADATVVGSSLKDLDYAIVQGHGETRVAAAAGLPPIIVGFSEGLQAATYSNYSQARRALADRTLRPLWRNLCGSMATLVDVPGGAELWYDDRDIPFLRDDASDIAANQLTTATAMRQLTDAGYDPDTVVKAIVADDMSLLEHSGLFSVQLRPPRSENDPPPVLPPGFTVPAPTPPGGSSTPAASSATSAAKPLPQLPQGKQQAAPPNGKSNSNGKRAMILARITDTQQLAEALIAARAGSTN